MAGSGSISARPRRRARGGACTAFLYLAMGTAGLAVSPAIAEKPERVASLNLCTDQLLLILAPKAQIASLSHLSVDPRASMMVEAASAHHINHGVAEEIIALAPDLVLAGTYTTGPTVRILRKLGYRVESFDPENKLEDIRSNILRLGELIGAETQARALADAFTRDLEALSLPPAASPRLFTNYNINGWTSGKGTIVADLAGRAGYQTLGEHIGFSGSRAAPLETLIEAHPDLIAMGNPWNDPPAVASQLFTHPALERLLNTRAAVDIPDRMWNCGLPDLLDVLRQVRNAPLAEAN